MAWLTPWKAGLKRHEVLQGNELLLAFKLVGYRRLSTIGLKKPEVLTGALSSLFFSFYAICVRFSHK